MAAPLPMHVPCTMYHARHSVSLPERAWHALFWLPVGLLPLACQLHNAAVGPVSGDCCCDDNLSTYQSIVGRRLPQLMCSVTGSSSGGPAGPRERCVHRVCTPVVQAGFDVMLSCRPPPVRTMLTGPCSVCLSYQTMRTDIACVHAAGGLQQHSILHWHDCMHLPYGVHTSTMTSAAPPISWCDD